MYSLYEIYIEKPDELYHHGIRGQKWGERNGPPYPLKPSAHSLAEQRAEYGSNAKPLKYRSRMRQNANTFLKSFAVFSTVPALIQPYLALNLLQSVQRLRTVLDKRDYFKDDGPPEKLSELKRLDRPDSMKNSLYKVNPRKAIDQKGTTTNCALCTVAMEMRARGYDVKARRRGIPGTELSEVETWFKGAKFRSPKEIEPKGKYESEKKYMKRAYDNLCTELESQGDGARGALGVWFKRGKMGHMIAWEVKDGAVKFYDGQNYSSKLDNMFSLTDPDRYSYTRLDDKKETGKVTNGVVSRHRKRDWKR